MFHRSEKKSFEQDSGSLESQETRPFTRNQVILCSTRGKIYAVHKKDGSRLWRQDFPSGACGSLVSVFVTDNDTIIAGGFGKAACLDLFTGESKWLNTMKGFGYEMVSVMATPSRFLSPSSTQESMLPSYESAAEIEKQLFFACSVGKVLAIDAETGIEAWKYNCPQGGFSIPAVIVEPSHQNTEWPFQVVYIGCGRRLYCLQASNGNVLWVSKVSNSKIGLGYMVLATPWSSRLAAEAHTDFSCTPHAQKYDQEQQNSASGS